ncbi:hypothetical protein [Peristeroidobacter agariperforans]|uniref:hypothetical protein n=1 Tax=Peristeroidobacter agariperforans TaxID=268404 RepID=UPI00101D475B|nr:hypothetical protein [Peristeroidobacter agariperforans]
MTESTERLTPQFSSQLAQTISVGNNRLFMAAVLLSIAPLWFGQNLPMVDMPQHAAQIAALREIWAGNAAFTQLFDVNWFTPYLLGYMLLYAGSTVLPVAVAAQLLVSLSLISIPLLTAALLRAAGADERWKWLAIPCAFGYAFYWGFLSFLVAVPFGLLFFIQAIRFAAAPSVRRGVWVAMASLALFFCHIIVLGFASMLALGYIAGAHYRDWKGLALRWLPYTAPLPLIAVWMFVTYTNEARVSSDPVVFGPVSFRLMQLLMQPAGQDSLALFTCVLVTGSVVLMPWLMGSKLNRQPQRWLPLLLGLAVFMTAPHYVFSTAYFYQRLGIFLVPLWLLLWDAPPAGTRRPDWLVMPLILLWMFLNTGRFAAFARETESFDRMVGHMEPGRRVAAMVYDKQSPLFALPVYLHFPAWYQAKRGGIVDFNFADFYSQMARYKRDAGPRIDEQVSWDPTAFDWEAHGGANYDYFLVKADADLGSYIFKQKLDAVELVARSDWWWLYRNKETARR